jgi:DnaD/phage-associated family protein
MSEPKQPYRIKDRPPTIFRVVKSKDNPYVMIDRRPIENQKLSFKAKGILTYLLSRPDGWEVSVADLIKRGTDGEAGIRAGLKELKNAGHMKYSTSRKAGRITGWLIEVYEVPDGDFLQVEILDVEKQDVENRTQVLSTLSNKENNNKNDDDVLATISKAYSSEIGLITPMIADELREASAIIPMQWTLDAIHEAASQNKRSWKYVMAILNRWKAQGNQEDKKQDVSKYQKPTKTNNEDAIWSVINANQ